MEEGGGGGEREGENERERGRKKDCEAWFFKSRHL